MKFLIATLTSIPWLCPPLRAMPQAARAAAASQWSLLRVSSRASIAIAVFIVLYLLAAFVSAAGAR